jgi:hypothetical protein
MFLHILEICTTFLGNKKKKKKKKKKKNFFRPVY